MQKKKRMEHVSFVLAVDGILVFIFTFKETFLLSYFSVTKSTKSQQREHSPLFANSLRVHELVARSSAWRVRAAKDKVKIGGFAALRNLILPRVRTYHTKKPSRFVHALPARPHIKVGIDRFAKRTRSASPRQGIRVWVPALWSSCADGIESVLSVFLHAHEKLTNALLHRLIYAIMLWVICMEKQLPKRKHPRLNNFDYSSAGAYFVTICTWNRRCLLSDIVGRGLAPADKVRYTSLGEIAEKQLLLLNERYPNLTVDQYVIMPNHIHIVFMIDNKAAGASPRPTISDIVCAYKSLTMRESGKIGFDGKLFQTSFHEHVVRGYEDYIEIRKYISENPTKWHSDELYSEI